MHLELEYYEGTICTLSPKGFFALLKLENEALIPYLSNKRFYLGETVWFYVVSMAVTDKENKTKIVCLAVNVTRKRPKCFLHTSPDCGEPFIMHPKGLHGVVLDDAPTLGPFKRIKEDTTNDIYLFQGTLGKDTEVGFSDTETEYNGQPIAAILHEGASI